MKRLLYILVTVCLSAAASAVLLYAGVAPEQAFLFPLTISLAGVLSFSPGLKNTVLMGVPLVVLIAEGVLSASLRPDEYTFTLVAWSAVMVLAGVFEKKVFPAFVAGAAVVWAFLLVPELGAWIPPVLTAFMLYFWLVEEGWFRGSIRVFPSLHFPVLVMAGWYFARHDLPVEALIPALAFMAAWHYAVAINDIYDREIDAVSNPHRPLVSGLASEKQYHEMYMSCALLAAVLGVAGKVPVHVLIFIFLAYVYSTPPARLKRFPVGSVFVAAGSVIAFHAGLVSSGARAFTGELVRVLLVMFLAFSAGIVIKDLKDVEGDKRAGVATLFTTLGVKRGLVVATLLLAIAFFSPLFLIFSLYDVVVFAVLYVITCVVLWMSHRPFAVFPLYFVEFLYVLLRYTGYISYAR